MSADATTVDPPRIASPASGMPTRANWVGMTRRRWLRPPISRMCCASANSGQPCVACHHTLGMAINAAANTPIAGHRLRSNERGPTIAIAVASPMKSNTTRFLFSYARPPSSPTTTHSFGRSAITMCTTVQRIALQAN